MRNSKSIISVMIVLLILVSMFTNINGAAPGYSGSAIKVNPIIGIGNDFIMGADVSMLKDLEYYGGKFYDDSGVEQDCLQILKDHGINWIRLRIWNDPTADASGYVGSQLLQINGKPAPAGTPGGAGNCDEQHTIELALRAKALGMKVLLDFHYSDFWTDPGQQAKPKAWKNHTGPVLQDDVYNFTKKVLLDMKNATTSSAIDPGSTVNAMPDMVQIGNENNNGMLWPEGNIANGYAGWIGLLNAGTRAVREVGGSSTKIMIHLANGGDNAMYRKIFDRFTDVSKAEDYNPANDIYSSSLITANGVKSVDFDVIGLSYYAFWHGPFSGFQANIEDLSKRYNKEIAIAEVGYGYTFDNGDKQSNAFSQGSDELGGYQATIQGQAQYVRDIMNAVSSLTDRSGKKTGLGIFYWEPEWIPVKDSNGDTLVGWITGGGDDSENRAMFDFNGYALPSLDVFNKVKDQSGQTFTPVINSLRSTSTTVTVAETPVLPQTVKADFSDGTIRDVPVVWGSISPADLQKLHTFTLEGSVAGTTQRAVVSISVMGKKNYVSNPGFETGSKTGWTVTEDSNADVDSYVESSPGNNAYKGSYAYHYYVSPNSSGFTIEQTITGLPNGNYTLRAVTQGEDKGGNTYIYAKGYGGAEKTASFTNTKWHEWKYPEVTNIQVTNGTCTIGAKYQNVGSGGWGNIDDFELYPDLSSAALTIPGTINAGSNFTARLSYTKLINNVYSQDITINYDSSKMSYVDAAAVNPGNVILKQIDSTPGTVRIIAANPVADGISWDADAINITFNAKQGATILPSDLTVASAVLGTAPNGLTINPSSLVTVKEAVVVIPETPGGTYNPSTNTAPVSTNTTAVSAGTTIEVKEGGKAVIVLKPVYNPNSGIATSTISSGDISKAFDKTKPDSKGISEIELQIPVVKGAREYVQLLPAEQLTLTKAGKRISMVTPLGTVQLPCNMLRAQELQAADTVVFSIGIADTSALDEAAKKIISSRPVIEINISAGGKIISWSNLEAPVAVLIPYTPADEELKDQEHIIIYYIERSGKLAPVTNAKYHSEKGAVVFKTTHLSKYAVAFEKGGFNDVKPGKWYTKAVEVLASKGISTGTSSTSFSPDKNITRGEFVDWLVKTLGLSAKYESNFMDVGITDSYYNSLGIAKALGITSGTGGNKCQPLKEISRQDMMVMTIKALEAAQISLDKGDSGDISKFRDTSMISSYAKNTAATMVKAGLIGGSGSSLNPKKAMTRAEAAQVLYNIFKKYM